MRPQPDRLQLLPQAPPAFAGAGYCPKCQGAAAKDWLAAREADLLPVGYFHLVFTLSAQIAPIAYQNKSVVYELLRRTASDYETLLTIAPTGQTRGLKAHDPQHLGARIGTTAVLHTWGSATTHHPHVHMIVPGGGIALNGTHWVHCKPGFLLPVRVLPRLFRRLFLTRLADAHAAGRLCSSASSTACVAARPSPHGRPAPRLHCGRPYPSGIRQHAERIGAPLAVVQPCPARPSRGPASRQDNRALGQYRMLGTGCL